MTPALIGLLGVIAGGLLGGLVSYRVERRQRRDEASVAARMIVFVRPENSVRVLSFDPSARSYGVASNIMSFARPHMFVCVLCSSVDARECQITSKSARHSATAASVPGVTGCGASAAIA
jgi:ABC-type lipoprotein release transport system permease subunit